MADGIPNTIDELPTSKPRFIGKSVAAHRGPDRCSPARRSSSTTSRFPGCCTARSCAARTRTRASCASTRAARGAAGRLRRRHRRGRARHDARRSRRSRRAGAPTVSRSTRRASSASRSPRSPPRSRYVAEDALELIDVEYEPLPAVVDAPRRCSPARRCCFDEHGTNVMLQRVVPLGRRRPGASATPITSSPRSSAGTGSARTRSRPSA